MKFAKLSKVDVREVWKHEAKDFTTEQESNVGKYSADILAREVSAYSCCQCNQDGARRSLAIASSSFFPSFFSTDFSPI